MLVGSIYSMCSMAQWPNLVRIASAYQKLSFKRVRKATAAFRRLGELVTPRRKEELERKFKDQRCL